MSRHWGIDVAFGVSLPNHWQDMVSHGLSFAIFRSGQCDGSPYDLDAVTPQAQEAIKAGVPFALYWAVNPRMDGAAQAKRFLECAHGYSYKALILDFELEHGLGSDEINTSYRAAYEYLKAKAKVPVVNYSGWWFIESYCQQMKEWITKDVYWEANYRQYFNPDTWIEFATQLADLYIPKYAGYPTIGLFQFAGDRPTTMVPHKIDYNLIDDDEVFNYLFHDGLRPTYLKKLDELEKKAKEKTGGKNAVAHGEKHEEHHEAPPVTTAHYRVSNATGTYVQAGPSWMAGMLVYLPCRADVYVDPSYTLTPGWLRLVSGGYVAANRVEEAVI